MLGELNPDEIEHVLRSETIGRIGCHAEGRTYIVPVGYAYDGHAVYGHSAEGMKLRMMRENPEVCFEVEHVDTLVNWQSVIAWGRFEELTGSDREHGAQLLVARVLPVTTGAAASATPPQIEAHIYRINLTEKTGRFERR